jgi:mycothiol system anti-sigma-R factor
VENAEANCREVLERLYLYLDGEIAAEDCEALDQHIRECACCFDTAEIERAFKALVRRKCGEHEAPPELVARLRTFIREL